jgi:hypothetical protein
MMTKTDTAPRNITEIEDAGAMAWLAEKLAAARARAREVPSADAVARMRERVLSEATPERERPSIAA